MYDEYDIDLQRKLANENARMEMLNNHLDEETSLSRRLKEFRKALSENKVLEEFDRGIFESMIEYVIVGGYDEDGNKDPYKLTFVYKTGFTHEIGDSKNYLRKKGKKSGKGNELCSNANVKAEAMCSHVIDNACGVRSIAVKG